MTTEAKGVDSGPGGGFILFVGLFKLIYINNQ